MGDIEFVLKWKTARMGAVFMFASTTRCSHQRGEEPHERIHAGRGITLQGNTLSF
jgi:hypothetical protein